MARFLDEHYGRTHAIKDDVCACCHGPTTTFTDALSRKEYTISGLCQTCQDEVFKEPTE